MDFRSDVVFFRNLLLQRTNILFDVAGPAPFARWAESGDASDIDAIFLNADMRRRVFEQAAEEFEREADQVIALLESRGPRDLVSVGPGNAIMETLLANRLSSIRSVTLIDIENSDSHHHGYARQGSGYSSLAASRDFMVSNGVSSASILLCNPRTQALPSQPFDCLISLLSMGFHYPCDDYVEYIRSYCIVSGILIIDLRKGVADPGFNDLLRSGFVVTKRVESKKFERLVVTRR